MGANWTVEGAAAADRRVIVAGELDLADEELLVDAVESLLASGAERVVIDLADVEFIDSSGVRALVRLRLAHGSHVRVGAVSDAVRRVLTVAGAFDQLTAERQPER